VSTDGNLLIITEVQQGKRVYENGPPWILNSEYSKSFEKCGLTQIFQMNNSKAEVGEETHLAIFQRQLDFTKDKK